MSKLSKEYKNKNLEELKKRKAELQTKIAPLKEELNGINDRIYVMEGHKEVKSTGGCTSVEVDF